MNVHVLVDDISSYRHAENFMHESGTVVQQTCISGAGFGSRRRAGSTRVLCVTLADATLAYGLQRHDP
jgi:hypothetical protein